MDAEGNLYAVNKSNHLFLGHHREEGIPQLMNPLAALGSGRSLALEFDAHGNLIMATAGVVIQFWTLCCTVKFCVLGMQDEIFVILHLSVL